MTTPYRQGPRCIELPPSREAQLELQLRILVAAICGALADGAPANGGDWAAIPMARVAQLRAVLGDVANALGLTLDERAKFFSTAMLRLELEKPIEEQLREANERWGRAEEQLARQRETQPEPAALVRRYGDRWLDRKEVVDLHRGEYEPPAGTRVVNFSARGSDTFVYLEHEPRSRSPYRG